MRVWFMSIIAVAGAFTLAACDSDGETSSAASTPAHGATVSSLPPTSSRTVICAKALGVVVLSEVGDDVQRRAQRARDTADVLDTLATETRDGTLSSALRGAAAKAAEVTTNEWGKGRLQQWATQEQQRFSALRKVCT
jgi:hypothetical protein